MRSGKYYDLLVIYYYSRLFAVLHHLDDSCSLLCGLHIARRLTPGEHESDLSLCSKVVVTAVDCITGLISTITCPQGLWGQLPSLQGGEGLLITVCLFLH